MGIKMKIRNNSHHPVGFRGREDSTSLPFAEGSIVAQFVPHILLEIHLKATSPDTSAYQTIGSWYRSLKARPLRQVLCMCAVPLTAD